MANKFTEDYYKEYIKLTDAAKQAQLNSLTAQSVKDKGVIDQKADDAIADAENTYTEKVKEESEKANAEHQKNAINRALNERYINERMANLGLSDSGYANVSQMGAQAYYQNTSREITEAEQKTLDTLAAALRESKASTEDWRTEQKANVDATLTANQLKVKNQYIEDAEKYASDMHKLDMEAREDKFDLLENYNKKVEDEKRDIVDFWSGEQKNYYVTAYAEKYGLDRALAELPKNIAFTELTEDWGKYDWWKYMRSYAEKHSVVESEDEYYQIEEYIPAEYRRTVKRAIRMRNYGG